MLSSYHSLTLAASLALASAPSTLSGQQAQAAKETLVVYQSPAIGTYQGYLLREVKKRYGDSADYIELSPNFPREIIDKETQEELFKNGTPKQVLVLADYKSFTPESVVTANKWIRTFDEDPFPDAKIAFFPSHPQYVTPLIELIHRQHYITQKALTRFDDQVISFAQEGTNVHHRLPIIEIKRDGKITEQKTTNQSAAYAKEANSGTVDYIARFGHSGPGFWQSTNLMDSFWVVGMDGESLLLDPRTSALKSKKEGEKFTGALDLEALLKRDRIKKYPRIDSSNPKIVDNYACCNSILPPHSFQGHEFSTIIPNMVGNNAFVWGYERDVTVVPQAGSHQLLFWGSNGNNSFTDSLLGSQIFVTAQRETLERQANTNLDYLILKEDEFSGMFFGLPDSLTHARTSSYMYDQKLEQTKDNKGKITTRLELVIKAPSSQNDYRMCMWSPPVILLPQEINPKSIENLKLTIDYNEYPLQALNQGSYSTAAIPDSNLSGEISFIDNALVVGIAPIATRKQNGQTGFTFLSIDKERKLDITFASEACEK